MQKTLLKKMGVLFSYLSTAFAMGCCGFGPFLYLTSRLSTLGLGFLAGGTLSLLILYASLGVTLGGLWISYRRHHHSPPLILGLISSGLILYPFHEALDVWIFRVFLSTGLVGLTIGVIWDLIKSHRSASAKKRSISLCGRIPQVNAGTSGCS